MQQERWFLYFNARQHVQASVSWLVQKEITGSSVQAISIIDTVHCTMFCTRGARAMIVILAATSEQEPAHEDQTATYEAEEEEGGNKDVEVW